jgi:hypothetical protein
VVNRENESLVLRVVVAASFLQLHPKVLQLAVVVPVPHRRLNLGPALLPVRPEAELQASSQQILECRPDLLSAMQTLLLERLPQITSEGLMEIATIPAKALRHIRAAQERPMARSR